jgi:predicted DNA-binding transcriptional regulator AlpA
VKSKYPTICLHDGGLSWHQYWRRMEMEELKLALEEVVYSEAAILELLGIDKKTLDDLRRERDFPYVRLTARARVYLADEVLTWMKEHARR